MAEYFTRYVALDDIRIRSAAQGGGDGRTVEAYAAIFNNPSEVQDWEGRYMEQVAPTAFTKTLSERAGQIRVLYNHGRTVDLTPSERYSMPIGVPLEMRADAKGLFTVTQYAKTELADEVLELIKAGAIQGQSFGGLFVKSTPVAGRSGYRADRSGKLPLVTRSEVALRDYGPTPFPAYEGAAITNVRALAALLQGTTATQPDPFGITPDGADADPTEPREHSVESLRAHLKRARIIRSI